MKKIKKRSKFQKCPKLFPSVQTSLGASFLETFFCSVFHGVIGSFRKNQKKSKLQKCRRSFPKLSKLVLNMFCGNFLQKECPVFHGGSGLRNFSKKSKKIQNSKNAQNRSQKCPNVFWTSFGAMFLQFFCPVFPVMHFKFSGLKIMSSVFRTQNKSSVFRNSTQQTLFLHSRHSQYTQPDFRFSGLKIMSSDSPN